MHSLEKQGHCLMGSYVGNLNTFAEIDGVLMPACNKDSMQSVARKIGSDVKAADSKVVVVVED